MSHDPELVKTFKEQWLEDRKAKAHARAMQPGQFYEINGICYRVRKVTPRDVILRRFSGTLTVPRVEGTAIQLAHARPA